MESSSDNDSPVKVKGRKKLLVISDDEDSYDIPRKSDEISSQTISSNNTNSSIKQSEESTRVENSSEPVNQILKSKLLNDSDIESEEETQKREVAAAKENNEDNSVFPKEKVRSILNDSDIDSDEESDKRSVAVTKENVDSSDNDEDRPFVSKETVRRTILDDTDDESKSTKDEHEDKSNSSESDVDEEEKQNEREIKQNESKSRPQAKKNKKVVEENMKFKIQSETERMIRDKEVFLPYHIPKKRSLKEFLERKKSTYQAIPLKASPKKMIKLLKEIEESTKSAVEFFKSDSENEDEETVADSNGVKLPEETVVSEKLFDKNIHQTISGTKEDMFPSSSAQNELNEAVKDDINSSTQKELDETGGDCVNPDFSTQTELDKTVRDENITINEIPDQFYENEATAADVNLNESEEPTANVKITELDIVENTGNKNTIQDCTVEEMETDTNVIVEKVDGVEKTENWLSDLLAFEQDERRKDAVKKRRENLLKRLKSDPKLKNFKPKLSEDNVIDLDESQDCSLQNGTKSLLDRFVKHASHKKKKIENKNVTINVVTADTNSNGLFEVKKEELDYHCKEIEQLDDGKPGSKFQRLREELHLKIVAKWEEEFKKKNNNTTQPKEGYEDEVLDDEEEEELSESEEEEGETESEPEEDDMPLTENKKRKSEFIDEEAEESADEGDDERDSEDEDEQDAERNVPEESNAGIEETVNNTEVLDDVEIPAYQPGGGLEYGGSNLSQAEDLIIPGTIVVPSLKIPSLDSIPESQVGSQLSPQSNQKKPLFNFPSLASQNMDEAYELCSGKFPDVPMDDNAVTLDQMKGLIGDQSQETDPFDFISGKFPTQAQSPKQTQTTVRKRLIIEEEDSNKENLELALSVSNTPVKYGFRMLHSSEESDVEETFESKKKKKLSFSDEEDDNTKADTEEDDADSVVDDEIEEGAEEREVEYDSEENEVVRNPTDFFDKEAELSESEWSGDEDEKGLDILDTEAGDADVLDHDEVKEELGKIHMRRVLDEDNREVRILQELLLEDGDLHSDGKRERKFRWKNIGAFDNDEDRKLESGDEAEEEDDEEWRKLRHERAVFLREMEEKGKVCSDDEDTFGEDSLLKMGKQVLQRVNKEPVKKQAPPVQQSPNVKKSGTLLTKRGSFLARNEEFLTRLAQLANTSENINGPKNSKNFVFATKSPEKTDTTTKMTKRKSENFPTNITKKLKTGENKFRRCVSLLDQLT